MESGIISTDILQFLQTLVSTDKLTQPEFLALKEYLEKIPTQNKHKIYRENQLAFLKLINLVDPFIRKFRIPLADLVLKAR